ncbi:hypothetical protein KCV05_g29, partial [Aureobasidium melanogenum]
MLITVSVIVAFGSTGSSLIDSSVRVCIDKGEMNIGAESLSSKSINRKDVRIIVTITNKGRLDSVVSFKLRSPVSLLALQTFVQVVLLTLVGKPLGWIKFSRPLSVSSFASSPVQ